MDQNKLKETLGKVRGAIKICGHPNPDADSILSALLLKDYFNYLGFESRVAIPERINAEQPINTAKILSIDLDSLFGEIHNDDAVFLVDCHNCKYSDNVIGCIDHHPTEEKIGFDFVINRKATSAAMIIIRLMEDSGMTVTDRHYVYAIYSAYLDTLSLKSVKTCREDIPWLDEKIRLTGTDKSFLTKFGLGVNDQDQPIDRLAVIGFKEYEIYGNTVATSYIMYDSLSEDVKRQITEHLIAERERTGYALWIYVFCNPIEEHTEMIEITRNGVEHKYYDRIISRSIDIVPMLESRFRP